MDSWSDEVSDSQLNNDFSQGLSSGWDASANYDYSSVDTDAIADQCDVSSMADSDLVNNVGDFATGLFSGLASEEIDGFNDATQLPGDLDQTISAWQNVDWSDGSSIQNALGSTMSTISDGYDAVNGLSGGALTSSAEAAVTEFATEINPVAGLVVGAGFASYNLAENSVDISNKLSNLATGLENGDWHQVGSAIGGIARDAIEVRNTAQEAANMGNEGEGEGGAEGK